MGIHCFGVECYTLLRIVENNGGSDDKAGNKESRSYFLKLVDFSLKL